MHTPVRFSTKKYFLSLEAGDEPLRGRGKKKIRQKLTFPPSPTGFSPAPPFPLSPTPFVSFSHPKDLLKHFSCIMGGACRALLLVRDYRDFRAKAKRGGKKAICGSEVNAITGRAVKRDERRTKRRGNAPCFHGREKLTKGVGERGLGARGETRRGRGECQFLSDFLFPPSPKGLVLETRPCDSTEITLPFCW